MAIRIFIFFTIYAFQCFSKDFYFEEGRVYPYKIKDENSRIHNLVLKGDYGNYNFKVFVDSKEFYYENDCVKLKSQPIIYLHKYLILKVVSRGGVGQTSTTLKIFVFKKKELIKIFDQLIYEKTSISNEFEHPREKVRFKVEEYIATPKLFSRRNKVFIKLVISHKSKSENYLTNFNTLHTKIIKNNNDLFFYSDTDRINGNFIVKYMDNIKMMVSFKNELVYVLDLNKNVTYYYIRNKKFFLNESGEFIEM